MPRLFRWLRGWIGRPPATWYHPDYRLPIPSMEGRTGAEPRRADLVAWHLASTRALRAKRLRTPELLPWSDLARVHGAEWLESLDRPETIARVFAAEPWEVNVDEIMRSVRLACGGTLAAARAALATGDATLNLLGGFHHAGPDFGGGHCAVNDVAVAVAALRAEGWKGRVAVLDLDAHPPDGTAACFRDDPAAWIGSISGSTWTALPGVDEVAIPGADDAAYLAALDGLLGRMPRAELVFVLAGGDVLAGDRFGALKMTLEGAGRRDERVYDALRGVGSVWLPGGGYHPDAWKVLARTAALLATGRLQKIPKDADPLHVRFASIARKLDTRALGAEPELSAEDLEEALGLARSRGTRLLGYYTPQGIEYALFRYGVLGHLARLGYRDFRVALDTVDVGDRCRVYGRDGGDDGNGGNGGNGGEHLLMECVLTRERIAGEDVLYVQWLTLRDPRAPFSPERPRLPGQEVPGLGLAREAGELFGRIGRRLGLAGVAWRPMHFHTAYTARYEFRFVDPARQGRFEALLRDTAHLPLAEVTRAIAEGRVRMNGEPYAWEPDVMLHRPDGPPPEDPRVAAERERVRFTL